MNSSDCWAVGTANIGTGTLQTLAEQWNGISWSIVTTPNPFPGQFNSLEGVACNSSSDCWAVGGAGDNSGTPGETLAEHWNGSTWSIVTTPNASAPAIDQLFGVACARASDCWAVGANEGAGGQTLAEHWNGSAWSIVTTPFPSGSRGSNLLGVACVSTSYCWAVGDYVGSGNSGIFSLAEHWNGNVWSIVTTPNPSLSGDTNLNGVVCVSAADCWAVGVSDAQTTLAEQWNGSDWSIVVTPNANPGSNQHNSLAGVTCITASDCWAIGHAATGSGNTLQTLAEQWNGRAWSIVSTPNTSPSLENGLFAVACASSSDCWTVGYNNSGNGDTLAEHGLAVPTTTTLSSTPAVAGQITTITANVKSAGGTPHGTVTFTNITTGKKLGTVGLKNGVASLNTVFPNPGSQTVRAYYNGNRTWAPSSATLTITVT